MRKIWILLIIIIIADIIISLTGCKKEINNDLVNNNRINFDTITFEKSLKGWELYSWPGANDFNYSILPGTNRIKTYSEVINNKLVVHGKDSIKMLLAKIPEKESVFWIGKNWLQNAWHSDYKDLSLPDFNTINEIKRFCDQEKLELVIDD